MRQGASLLPPHCCFVIAPALLSHLPPAGPVTSRATPIHFVCTQACNWVRVPKHLWCSKGVCALVTLPPPGAYGYAHLPYADCLLVRARACVRVCVCVCSCVYASVFPCTAEIIELCCLMSDLDDRFVAVATRALPGLTRVTFQRLTVTGPMLLDNISVGTPDNNDNDVGTMDGNMGGHLDGHMSDDMEIDAAGAGTHGAGMGGDHGAEQAGRDTGSAVQHGSGDMGVAGLSTAPHLPSTAALSGSSAVLASSHYEGGGTGTAAEVPMYSQATDTTNTHTNTHTPSTDTDNNIEPPCADTSSLLASLPYTTNDSSNGGDSSDSNGNGGDSSDSDRLPPRWGVLQLMLCQETRVSDVMRLPVPREQGRVGVSAPVIVVDVPPSKQVCVRACVCTYMCLLSCTS